MKKTIWITVAFLIIGIFLFGSISLFLNNKKKEEKRLNEEKIQLEKEQLEAKIEEQKVKKRKEKINESQAYVKGYFYDKALEVLKSDSTIVNEVLQDQIEEVEKEKDSLVEYTGEVDHIFFHSLIIYPSLAFDNKGSPASGYNSTMSTRDEFVKMLPQLYERGYVLYDLDKVFVKDEKGNMVKNKIYLPKGKKPLVISQDDLSYYKYMKLDGFASKLVLDENGEVATLVKDLSGNSIVTRDGDIVPILDDFIKLHPDFSFQGAKGVIATTGYEGTLGYDLLTEQSRIEAKKIADKLKETGWKFANHSYTHNRKNFWGQGSNVGNIKYDVNYWNKEIKPIVGATNLFIAPFGWVLSEPMMSVLTDQGYNIYCSVTSRNKMVVTNPKIAVMGRYEIAGYNMFKDTNYVNSKFFNVLEIREKTRPTM